MRMTRAAMRAQAQDETDAISIHEDRDTDAPQDQGLQEEDTARPALKDITDDNYSTTTDEVAELKQSTRGKKAKGIKRKIKQSKDNDEQDVKMAEEVTDQANADNNAGGEQQPAQEEEVAALETPAHALATPDLATEADKRVAHTPEKPTAIISSKTPKFDPELHAPAIEPPSPQHGQEDSFVDSIKTRSPIKLNREPSHDSFIESIKSASPAGRASRIEDSVEAMDALEDAIEEISTKLPQIEHIEIESPVKDRNESPPKPLPPAARKTAHDTKVAAKTPKPARSSPTKTKTAQLKSAPPRISSGRVSTIKPAGKGPTINKSTSRPTTGMPKSITTEAPKTTMSPSNSHLKTQPNLAKKRVTSGPLSTSRPGFVPAKSSKPPTKSTFALPGEAVAAKLKAQREERAKQEEGDRNKTTFKARPAPLMTARPSVAPRENKASLARKSSAPAAAGQGENKENVAPKPRPKPRLSAVPGGSSKTLDVKTTRPEVSKANSSVRRTTSFTQPTNGNKKPTPATRPSIPPKPTPRPSIAPRVASLSRPVKPSPPASTSDTAQNKITTKVNGKEVYGRTKLELKRLDDEKREKEEAAKKARAEAAERGRQASREWAERQKRKMEAQKAAATAAANGIANAVGAGPAAVEAN